MAKMEIEYLGKPEIDKLALTNDEILDAVEKWIDCSRSGRDRY